MGQCIKIKGQSPFFVIALVLLLSACTTSSNYRDIDTSSVSLKQERYLGLQGHRSISMQKPFYDNKRLQNYVKSIGHRISNANRITQMRYSFNILNDSKASAYSLPGGFVYITTGLLAYLNSEEELVAVLGHEMAHIAYRHGLKKEIFYGVIDSFGKEINKERVATRVDISLLNFQEQQADQLGMRYASNLGYSADGMISILKILQSLPQYNAESAFSIFRRSLSSRLDKLIQANNNVSSEVFSVALKSRYFKKINGLSFRVNEKTIGHIAIKKIVSPNETFELLAQKSSVNSEYLRKLNGYNSNEQPPLNSLIKIIK